MPSNALKNSRACLWLATRFPHNSPAAPGKMKQVQIPGMNRVCLAWRVVIPPRHNPFLVRQPQPVGRKVERDGENMVNTLSEHSGSIDIETKSISQDRPA